MSNSTSPFTVAVNGTYVPEITLALLILNTLFTLFTTLYAPFAHCIRRISRCKIFGSELSFRFYKSQPTNDIINFYPIKIIPMKLTDMFTSHSVC